MRRVVMHVVALVLLAPTFRPDAYACGDKFLKVGQATRFNQAYAAIYPARILLYAGPSHDLSKGVLDPKFQTSLTRAGHHLEVIKEESVLMRALQSDRIDLVLADVVDVDVIRPRADQSPSKPTVLPVVFKSTKAEEQAIKTRYERELKTSDRPARYLSQIDNEMKARVKLRGTRKTS